MQQTVNYSRSDGFLSTFGSGKSISTTPRLRGAHDPLVARLRKPNMKEEEKPTPTSTFSASKKTKTAVGTTRAQQQVTSPMTLFMKLQSALVASGFNEGLWSLVRESELLGGLLLPFGLFLRHTLQAFPSAALQALNTVDGFVVEGTDEKLVVQIYKLLDSMFDYKPAISSNQFVKAYNPCGTSKFCGHMIQTCSAFHTLMSQREKALTKELRNKQNQLLLQKQHAESAQALLLMDHHQQQRSGATSSQSEGGDAMLVNLPSTQQLQLMMTSNNNICPDYREESEKLAFQRELQETRNEILGDDQEAGGGGVHHGGPAEALDRSEFMVGGMLSSVHSEYSDIVHFDNAAVHISTHSNIPIKIGGKLAMRCVEEKKKEKRGDRHHRASTHGNHNHPVMMLKNNAHHHSVHNMSQQQHQGSKSSELVVVNRDRFGQYMGGDISSTTHFETNLPEKYQHEDAGCSPTSYVAGGEVLDALIQIEGGGGSTQQAPTMADGNGLGTIPTSMGCCTRHALHTLKHHNRAADKAKVDLCKLELQHAALNSQKRAPLNREVGGFRL